MYISNSCIFPENWTAETLLEKHRSIPTNPKIANTFYRAGYVESWGRGIQKICEECEKNGAKPPKFEILGNTFAISFSALDTAARLKHHTKHQGDGLDDVLDERIIKFLQVDRGATQKQMSKELGTSLASIQRAIKRLTESGRIERKGGKRFGYWEVK